MNGAKLPDGRSVLPMNDQVTSLLHDMQYGDGAVQPVPCPACYLFRHVLRVG
jgi:hypothetical protein